MSQPAGKEEDARRLAQQRFARIYQDVLIEGNGSTQEDAVSQAIKLAKTAHAVAKYFPGEAPRPDLVSSIDAAADGRAASGEPQPKRDAVAQELYGNLFCLCMALKPRPGLPASAEDPNFDADRVEKFFQQLPSEERHAAVEASLELMGKLAESIVEQGCTEFGASPAKLRSVLLMLSHPGLADPSDFEALKRLMLLTGRLHEQAVARDILVRWLATVPLAFLDGLVGQVQQFVTLSILEVQSDVGGATSLDVATKIATHGDLARHTRNALRTLDIFWLANDHRRKLSEDWRTKWKALKMRERGETFEDEATKFVEGKQFHNDAINECEGILKLDLRECLEMQHLGKFRHADMEDAQRKDFGIIEFPFVLNPESKVRMLSIESVLSQREEARHALARQMLTGRTSMNPYLVLKVRRTHIVQDALQQLAERGSSHYKRPLKIVFDGEDGVDEGGVQKEFFQLLIEELYNEDFGMFERNEESRTFWFNKNSFEVNLQFELFGLVLGLAIYNQVILDVKFPKVVYQKLMAPRAGPTTPFGLTELIDFDPSLAKGLLSLLEHEPAPSTSFEEVFGPMRFVVEYECFGSNVEVELKEGGKDASVTWETRDEYVQKYCDWIFCASIEKQYAAFRRGFDQCIGDTLFRRLFREEELELVICGSVELDFLALEKATTYQDGFNASCEAVKWFWEVVHSLSAEDKRSLLQFCTGCDRSPVGGLGRLPFIVSRNGPDSDMLPSVHTCFNHLLLPAYSTKEKLERCLRLAIQHSHGFGLM